MYSRLRMPHVEWREENRRYSLGFFPLVGAVIALLTAGWYLLAQVIELSSFLFGAGAVIIPIAVTGGIHLDGYCDFTDAVSSYADKEKRLAIMSDPHVGSFAVMRACLYLILQTALFTEISSLNSLICAACGYVLSRGLSGLMAVTLRSAKSDGSLQSFVKPSHKAAVIVMLSVFIAASAGGMIYVSALAGFAGILTSVIVFLSCRRKAYKTLDGITGDVCGWFLQKCELWMLAAIVLIPKFTAISLIEVAKAIT